MAVTSKGGAMSKRIELRTLLEKRRQAAETTRLETDLAAFFRWAWEIIEPETPLVWSWHYALLAEWLMLVSSGEFKRRYPEKSGLVICVPFRSAKSSFCTIAWPVWSGPNFPGGGFW